MIMCIIKSLKDKLLDKNHAVKVQLIEYLKKKLKDTAEVPLIEYNPHLLLRDSLIKSLGYSSLYLIHQVVKVNLEALLELPLTIKNADPFLILR